MKIAVGSDERTALTDAVLNRLQQEGHELSLVGALDGKAAQWPQIARQVAEAVAEGGADEGLLFCWTGTGVCIAANKIPGVRAALCDDAETARGARLWNDANVLCIKTSYQPNPEDDACLAAVAVIERAYGHTK